MAPGAAAEGGRRLQGVAPYRLFPTEDPCAGLQKRQCLSREHDDNCEYVKEMDWKFDRDNYNEKDEGLNGSGCQTRSGIDRLQRTKVSEMTCDTFYTQSQCKWARRNGVEDGACRWHDCDLSENGNPYCSNEPDTRSCSNLKRSDWNVDDQAITDKCILFGRHRDSAQTGSFMAMGCDDDDWADDYSHAPYLKQPLTIPVKISWDVVMKKDCTDMGFMLVEHPESTPHIEDFDGPDQDNWNNQRMIGGNNWCSDLQVFWHDSDGRRHYRDSNILDSDNFDEDYWAPNMGEQMDPADRVRFEWEVTNNGQRLRVWNRVNRAWDSWRGYYSPFSAGETVYLAAVTDNDDPVDYDYNDDGTTNDIGAFENLIIHQGN
jgi:hypothetical protein